GIALVPAAPQQGQTYEVVWFGAAGAKPPTVAGSFTPAAPGTPAAAAAGTESTPVEASTTPIAITPDTSGAGLSTETPTLASPPAAAASPSAPAGTNRVTTRARQIGSVHRAPPWPFHLGIVVGSALLGPHTLRPGD